MVVVLVDSSSGGGGPMPWVVLTDGLLLADQLPAIAIPTARPRPTPPHTGCYLYYGTGPVTVV